MTQILLIIHVAAGTLALISGGVAGWAAKGQRLHVLSGRIFTLMMAVCSLAGLTISIIKSNGFLLAVSLFTFYMVLTGYLFGKIRQPEMLRKGIRLASVFGVLSTIYMFWIGINAGGAALAILGAFGGLMAIFSGADLFLPVTSKIRIPRHGARMGGAYIAALTALLVVNVRFDPAWVLWLAPGAIGGWVLTRGIRNWVRKTRSV